MLSVSLFRSLSALLAIVAAGAFTSDVRASEICNLPEKLAKIEASLPSTSSAEQFGDLLKVIRKEEREGGSYWVVWQGGASFGKLDPEKGAEYGIVEGYVGRPELAKKMG